MRQGYIHDPMEIDDLNLVSRPNLIDLHLIDLPAEILYLIISFCDIRSTYNMLFVHSLIRDAGQEQLIVRSINEQLDERGFGFPTFSRRDFLTFDNPIYLAARLKSHCHYSNQKIKSSFEPRPHVDLIRRFQLDAYENPYQFQLLATNTSRIKEIATSQHPVIWQDVASGYYFRRFLAQSPLDDANADEWSSHERECFLHAWLYSFFAFYSSPGRCIESMACLVTIKKVIQSIHFQRVEYINDYFDSEVQEFYNEWMNSFFIREFSEEEKLEIKGIVDAVLIKYVVAKYYSKISIDFSVLVKNIKLILANFNISELKQWFRVNSEDIMQNIHSFEDINFVLAQFSIEKILQFPLKDKMDASRFSKDSMELLYLDDDKKIQACWFQERGTEIAKINRLNQLSKRFSSSKLLEVLPILDQSITWSMLLRHYSFLLTIRSAHLWFKHWKKSDLERYKSVFQQGRQHDRYRLLSILEKYCELAGSFSSVEMITLIKYLFQRRDINSVLQGSTHKGYIIRYFYNKLGMLDQLHDAKICPGISYLDVLALSRSIAEVVLQRATTFDEIISLMNSFSVIEKIRCFQLNLQCLEYLWESFSDKDIIKASQVPIDQQFTLYDLLLLLSKKFAPSGSYVARRTKGSVFANYPDLKMVFRDKDFLLGLALTIEKLDLNHPGDFLNAFSDINPQDLFMLHQINKVALDRNLKISTFSMLHVFFYYLSRCADQVQPKKVLTDIQSSPWEYLNMYVEGRGLKLKDSVTRNGQRDKPYLSFFINRGVPKRNRQNSPGHISFRIIRDAGGIIKRKFEHIASQNRSPNSQSDYVCKPNPKKFRKD